MGYVSLLIQIVMFRDVEQRGYFYLAIAAQKDSIRFEAVYMFDLAEARFGIFVQLSFFL